MERYRYDLSNPVEEEAAWDTRQFHGWTNFSPHEIACKCCGVVVFDTEAMSALQNTRRDIGKPLIVNSGYRCPTHNGRVGGASKSMHLWGRAFDINTRDWTELERYELVALAGANGFAGFGFYRDFIHIDTGRQRFWTQIAPQLFEDEE